jgi:hypothetical protein
MTYFVYTLKRDSSNGPAQALFASSEEVNAQPLRQIQTMMTVQAGEITLHLPEAPGAPHLVQRGRLGFQVDQFVLIDDLDEALAASRVSVKEFNAAVATLTQKQRS